QATDYYNRMSANGLYEEYTNEKRLRGPVIAAQSVADFFPDNRSDKLILDLHRLGFPKLHALDPSEGMLHVARQKNVYEKLYCCYLDQNRLPIDDDVYDCAASSGGFGEGHIPVAGLHELARIVKPGGLVSIVMREMYLETVQEYRGRLEPVMAEMQTAGKWRQLSRKVVSKYYFDDNGVVFEFVVC
ncbi:hypothetical protein BaRGS_00036532, partial [Batillaria attramentaria]